MPLSFSADASSPISPVITRAPSAVNRLKVADAQSAPARPHRNRRRLRAVDPLDRLDPRIKLYAQKYRWYERNTLPWNRARIHLHMLRAQAFIRFPVQGNVLESLDDGRLTIGEQHAARAAAAGSRSPMRARVSIGEGCFLNLHTMIAAQNEVTIGDHTMFANHCFVSDSSHRYDDRTMPITWQGFTSKGPTRIGSNCWFGIGCVDHQRRDDRRSLCRRRQLGRHARPAARRDRRGRAGQGDPRDRLRAGGGRRPGWPPPSQSARMRGVTAAHRSAEFAPSDRASRRPPSGVT